MSTTNTINEYVAFENSQLRKQNKLMQEAFEEIIGLENTLEDFTSEKAWNKSFDVAHETLLKIK